jgi:YcaO-like protein with predicted kinase domain
VGSTSAIEVSTVSHGTSTLVAKAHYRGTHRVTSPAYTVERARRLVGPLGITRIGNVTGLDCIGIPVVTVCRPNARSLAVSQGKGLDLDAARASGLMEAIELYHAERISHPLKFGSWNELRFSHSLVRVDDLPRTTVSVFHPDRTMLWICGNDLASQEATWLPFELVHTNFTLPLPSGSGCFVMSSNGLASGNHFLEAVSHGLCEVVERDAAVLFRLKTAEEQENSRVDLATIADADCRRVLGLYEAADVSVGVWDTTSDVMVPCFQCVIADRDPNPFRRIGPVQGMGCHPAREVALLRALTEAAQGRLTLIAGSRDDNGRAQYLDSQDATLVQRALRRLRLCGSRKLEEAPTIANGTFEEDVAAILAALRAVGVDRAMVVDLTKPEFGIPVVRIVVPGLETHPNVKGYVPGDRARRILEARGREAKA